MPNRQEVARLLQQLEQEMLRQGLWSSTPPSPAAMASRQPFCCDTLSFSQWLQYVLLPKMALLLESGQPLPGNFAIHPMAEEAFKLVPQDTRALTALILQLDRLCNSDG